MNTTKSTLKKALAALPINSLIVIAAELERNRGDDQPEEVQEAIEELQLDVINAAVARLDGHFDFLQAVNWWYMSHDSRAWYQKILNTAPSARPKMRR